MKKFLTCFLLIFLLISAGFAFAQEELEVGYPDVPGARTPTLKTGLPAYVKYIFNFSIWAAGIIALFVLIQAGMNYFMSAGNPEAIKDAKDQITAVLFGLLILFASYLILVTINPQLIIFRLSPIPPLISTLKPGVLACIEPEKDKPRLEVMRAWGLFEDFEKANSIIDDEERIDKQKKIKEELDPIMENISDHCYYIEGGGNIQKEFDKWGVNIKYVYLIPKEEEVAWGTAYVYYGAIIYEKEGFDGESEVLWGLLTDRPVEKKEGDLRGIKISSIRPFVFDMPKDEHKVVLYEEIDFNFEGDPSKKTFPEKPDAETPLNACIGSLSFTPQSIEIIGDYIVILYTEEGTKGESEVFIEPGDADLNNNKVACRGWKIWRKKSCVKSACIYGGRLY